MVMNLDLVCMVCQCNVYVIPESVSRKDLGYKGYEFLTIASFAALFLLPCTYDFGFFSVFSGSAVDLRPACLQFSNMNNPAVDLRPACFRFSNMNNPAVDLRPLCFRFHHPALALASYILYSGCGYLRLYFWSVLHFSLFLQTSSSSTTGFAWNGQLFFQAQSRLAAHFLQTSSRQSRAHNHRLLSALLNGPIQQAGVRLVSVLHDQGYLAVSVSEHVSAFAAFSSPLAAVGVSVPPREVVTDDMQIALADDIIARTVALALIPPFSQSDLHAMALAYLEVRTRRYTQWPVSGLSPPRAVPESSRPPPALNFRQAAQRRHITTMASMTEESDLADAQYVRSPSDFPQPLLLADDLVGLTPLSSVEMRNLGLMSALPPIPYIGGWGSSVVFQSPELRQKALLELQQMDAVLDPVLFDVMAANTISAQKAQLVTLKWRTACYSQVA